jgi:hypothetical protein
MAAMLFFHQKNLSSRAATRTRWQSGPFRLMRSIGTLSLMILMLLVVPISADDIYRWRDGAGVLHFADSPPASGKADRMSSSTGTDFSRIPQSQPAATLSNVSRGGVFWRIEQGGAFIAVGALHLAGPTSSSNYQSVDTG